MKAKNSGQAPRILMLEWHLTRRCNLNCSFCYLDYNDPRPELTDTECLALLAELAKMGVPGIIFSGGEPLLRPELVRQLIARCRDAGMRAVLATNGLLLTGALLAELREAGLDMVGISLDAADPALHDRLRGAAGAFAGAVEAIRRCREAGVPVQVQTVAGRENWREVVPLTGLCCQWGVSKYLVLDFVPTGRGRAIQEGVLHSREREALLDYVYRTGQVLGERLRMEYVEPYWQRKICQEEPVRGKAVRERFFQGGTCMGGNSFVAVMPAGDVFPCPRLPVPAGNVREQSFSEIWEHSPVLHNLRSFDALNGACRTCTSREICDGCRARALFYQGDYLAPDPFCLKNAGLGGATGGEKDACAADFHQPHP